MTKENHQAIEELLRSIERRDVLSISLFADEAAPAIRALLIERDALSAALNGVIERYTSMVNSGDCGNWNPEAEECVIIATTALSPSPALTTEKKE